MLRLRNWQGAAVVLACCGMMFPNTSALADAPRLARTTPATKAQSQKAADVALTSTGHLVGAAFTPDGKQLDGATVIITQGDNEIVRTNTNTEGSFAVAQLKPGAYQVAVGDKVAPIRVWNADAAPPKAKTKAILVVGEVVRGQDMYEYCPDGNCPPGDCGPGGCGPLFGLDVITLVTVGAAATAAAIAIVNLKKNNDIEDKLHDIHVKLDRSP